MSRRRTHVRAGVIAAAVGLVCIGLAARWNPSIPVLAGAMRTYHLFAGGVVALGAGWFGARIPDLIEPARLPRHRGFWHSKLVAGVLLVGAALLAGGYLLSGATPMAFLLRTAFLFLIIGYASHLVLDHFSSWGLPNVGQAKIAWGSGSSGSAFVKALLLLILVLAAPPVTQTFWVFAEALLAETATLKPLAIGTALGVGIDRMARSQMRRLYIFVHELTHAAAALAGGRTVTHSVLTLNDGFVARRGEAGRKPGNVAISLAPYVFPLPTVLSVAARAALPPDALFWFDLWIGTTISFHLLWTLRTIWEQYSGSPGEVTANGQSGIAENGLLVSSLYVLVVGLAIWGVIFAALLEGYSGALLWAEAFGQRASLQQVFGIFI